MAHLIYILPALIIGFLLGWFASYVFFKSCYTTRQQRQKIIHFINGMKKLKKSGRVAKIKKSIETFANKCVEFDSDSFKNFKIKQLDEIAKVLAICEGQTLPFQDNQDGIVNNLQLNVSYEYVSPEEKYKKVFTNLCELIGIP